ncbi:hypothetical protein [Methylomonas koyamae]|uniref:Uncharacterized protein n=1 Tax=Methylomonas koyamae TaxID=702114 RepID=A0A177NNZ5_9GAMM|nr:hypothetical protein [Methylomonas koyamae]OAI19063.1 hypothetical protein A1355_04940 [Methylomonas koyamae]
MDKVIDKLSPYNIFTNLFPGVIYCFVATKFFGLSLIQDDLVVAAFLYYFCGMVISRVSSVVVEPLMKKTGFVTYADYSDYVAASAADKLIEQLLETSNSYRSVVALALCLVGTGAWTAAVATWPKFGAFNYYILLIALLVLFSLAFRKQTQYITKRVTLHKEKSGMAP